MWGRFNYVKWLSIKKIVWPWSWMIRRYRDSVMLRLSAKRKTQFKLKYILGNTIHHSDEWVSSVMCQWHTMHNYSSFDKRKKRTNKCDKLTTAVSAAFPPTLLATHQQKQWAWNQQHVEFFIMLNLESFIFRLALASPNGQIWLTFQCFDRQGIGANWTNTRERLRDREHLKIRVKTARSNCKRGQNIRYWSINAARLTMLRLIRTDSKNR